MANIPANIAKSSKFREINEIMAQPSMKALLNSYIDEAVKCKTAIALQQELLKGFREQALNELGLKPAVFNTYVQMVYQNDYVQRKGKLQELIDLVDQVMLDQDLLPGPRADDE
ncbi:hypothetical protein [Acinetobacter sp.]|uniref:hypothetical protein n=1 Tax=Acinetobacter sp. TaxID=472 RepID=UPI003890CF7B